MLTCDKCGAQGFIAVEEDEFHCLRCGLIWYVRKQGAGHGEGRAPERIARPGRRVDGEE